MDGYWDIVDKERSIIQESYNGNPELYELAISAWEKSVVFKYFKDFHDQSALVVMYKTQADVALMRAITSILRKEYSQAIYNIRLATENLVISVFAYSKPDELASILASDDKDSADSKIKKAANKFLATDLPERSKRFKALHQMCDKFGSHQTLSHHSSHFSVDDIKKEFTVSLYGTPKQELDVGLTGIVVGTIIEFHFAISALGEVEWIKLNTGTRNSMNIVSQKLDEMKRKYMHLYVKAMM